MKSLYLKCEDIKRKGPASIDLAYVASGKLDADFEPNLKLWDIAAGVLLVEEAGGKVTNWAGETLTLDITQSVVVSNGLIQQELMKYL
jgi:myo-inositol-1(or 4)-monophosphatase